MATYYVHINMGYCGTDDTLEIEAKTADEAYEEAHQHCLDLISINVCDSEDEADECHGY